MEEDVYFSELEGKRILSIELERIDDYPDPNILIINTDAGSYKMYHHQQCCETVELIDGIEELDQMVGQVITEAYCSSREETETSEWTFYNISTKEYFTSLRWYGYSNGYYSTGVSFVKINGDC